MYDAKIRFEVVALWDEIIFSYLPAKYAIAIYPSILEMFGWSKKEYEKELLKRIDEEWVNIHKVSTKCLSN